MKKIYKILLILFSLAVITSIVLFNINLLLNKKYAVDEISYTKRPEGLVGIQQIITQDYIYMLYFNIFYILILISLIVLIFRMRRKVNNAFN